MCAAAVLIILLLLPLPPPSPVVVIVCMKMQLSIIYGPKLCDRYGAVCMYVKERKCEKGLNQRCLTATLCR